MELEKRTIDFVAPGDSSPKLIISEIYFCKLTPGNFVQTWKMTLGK